MRHFVEFLAIIIFGLPSVCIGFIWGYIKQGWEIGVDIAEENQNAR